MVSLVGRPGNRAPKFCPDTSGGGACGHDRNPTPTVQDVHNPFICLPSSVSESLSPVSTHHPQDTECSIVTIVEGRHDRVRESLGVSSARVWAGNRSSE